MSSPVLFVDLVAEAHRVYDGELEVHVALLQVVGPRPEIDAVLVVAGLLVFEHGVEQGVHQRGLADARLTWHHSGRHRMRAFSCNKCTLMKYLNYIKEICLHQYTAILAIGLVN